ncbi:hypothetical protein [Ilyobacter sp.]|uniref:hypothetical protein n=1 Tax=Ilyobacter sp. TaxID=3100343 RepID=UPI003568C50A
MEKRGFILPLVLLILALMSGIAVVLGRLSSEKTLSLKKQESSYYAKEITVILVDEDATEDSGTTDDSGNTSDSTSGVSLASNNSSIDVDFTGVKNGTYNIEVKITSTKNIKNVITAVTVNGNGTGITLSETTTGDRKYKRTYTGTITVENNSLIITIGSSNSSSPVVAVNYTLTE